MPSSHQRARPARGRLRARPRPRLRDARRARDATPRGIAAALASAELSTVWLHHADPLRAFPDRAAWEAALGTAQTVIAVDSVLTDTIREHADVVFPAEAYAEKEGTLTHPDGRVQRLRPAIGRPKGPDQQSGSGVRPLWQVIADVAERTGLELGVRTGPMASQQLFDAVPFYAGLTLDAIGGRGIRWPASEAAAAFEVAPWEPVKLDVPDAVPATSRGRAAPGHLPLAVELQGGRRLAVAALPAPAPGRRALARRRGAARDPRRRPGRGRLERDAREGAVKLRAAVPGGSVFLASGHARAARQRAHGADGRGPPRRARRRPSSRAPPPRSVAPAAEGLSEMPASAPQNPEGKP